MTTVSNDGCKTWRSFVIPIPAKFKEEFLNPIGMSQNQLAQAIGVPGNRIHAIVNGTRAITGDTDLRFCKFFGLSEGYFLRLQNAYDTLEAKRRIAAQLAKIKPYKRAKAA